jgi:2-dehydro-3-deoxyphosphogluconate aldolase/(4S)-4-hydroxy-2-oxoglutarate aldolase
MDSSSVYARFTELKIIPVITIESSEYSLDLADALIEAGLPCAEVKEACDMGAGFIVSPGFGPKVVEYCMKNSITVIPGTSTPTDIGMALDHGLTVVKFFPAENFGGAGTLRAISAPYPMMRFIPTGGINRVNMMAYLALSNVVAVGGSWMVEKGLINSGNFSAIMRLTKEAISIFKEKGVK